MDPAAIAVLTPPYYDGRYGKTISGYDIDIVKSALQKYIRRGICDKAIISAIELFRMSEVGGFPVVTNLYNRLAIIASEDIGLSNLPLVVSVIQFVEERNYKIKKKIPFTDDINILISIVLALCQSTKTRMMSHCHYAYTSGQEKLKMVLAQESDFTFHVPPILSPESNYDLNDRDYINLHLNSEIFDPTDPLDLRYPILAFERRLENSDYNAFYWYDVIMEVINLNPKIKNRKIYCQRDKMGVVTKTGKSQVLIWSVLKKILHPEVHDTLAEAAFTHNEDTPFYQLAILSVILRVPYTEKINLTELPTLSEEDFLNLYNKRLEVDSYVIDKHTSLGRKRGSDITKFVQEGAIVANQDKKYFNLIFEKVYTDR